MEKQNNFFLLDVKDRGSSGHWSDSKLHYYYLLHIYIKLIHIIYTSYKLYKLYFFI